jgi:hypothetical protein
LLFAFAAIFKQNLLLRKCANWQHTVAGKVNLEIRPHIPSLQVSASHVPEFSGAAFLLPTLNEEVLEGKEEV